MIRHVIENLLLFLLPTLVYVTYVWFSRDEATPKRDVLAEAPLIWLTIVGASLVVVTMALFGSTSGGKPGDGYSPPGMQDGKIIPGHQQ